MSNDNIVIKGARQHNLKNIDLTIPKNKLVVFTGISGSGKSSLAFDTLYAEGQRRYVESLSAYARQFLGVMDKPDVDYIEGLSPAISIDQKSSSHNPRSTVGTTTEVYDYLRLLFARVGHPHCPICGREISSMSVQQIADAVISKIKESSKKQFRFFVMAPVVKDRKGEFTSLFEELRKKGFSRIRIDGYLRDLSDSPRGGAGDFMLLKNNKHTIDLIVDRLVLDKKSVQEQTNYSRLIQSIETASKMGEGSVIISEVLDASLDFPQNPKKLEDHLYSEKFSCPIDNIALSEIEPRLFSFNSPHGACPECTGLGSLLEIDPESILNPILSIAEGGILPWSKLATNETWFTRLVEAVGKEFGFNLSTRLGELSGEARNILLYGAGNREFEVEGKNRQGRWVSFYSTFKGLAQYLKERYRETESEWVKSEIEKYMIREICPLCRGCRLKPESLSVTLYGLNIAELTTLSIKESLDFVKKISGSNVLSDRELIIGKSILKEIQSRLQFLSDVGLDYLTLDRASMTLAGGESQRIRLASQIGSGLSGVLYVLDEPSIGLHQRDNSRLITTLKKLRDLGNTVIVNEHDAETMLESDYMFEIGPGAGEYGGKIVAKGTPKEIINNPESLTGKYLSGKKKIEIFPEKKNGENIGYLEIINASQHNLKNVSVKFPLGKLISITGVSGSGKSTLVHDVLFKSLAQKVNHAKEKPGKHEAVIGIENIDKVILVDQSPIGRTPRSNPATYTGAFTFIRELFASSPEAKIRGYGPGRFSFNVKGGRCEVCEGDGQIKIEMQFLPDVFVTCEGCDGKRYNREALEIHFKDKDISQVLDLTVEEALDFFTNIPQIKNKFSVLYEVGLGYIHLGQPATTLYGGEAQRIKLSSELSKRQTGRTVYILDEPTTGLHFADIERLLKILRRLVDLGNTVIIIEHNLDVVKNADWIIDLGPEGGVGGGQLVGAGIPKDLAKIKSSYTGQYLAKIL
ncbi:excinuclease ABC subunit UvrA [Candidatus Daviesbacteria bacterium]|nr:excinuclease ABC subunit UvrA [Candidatus Daviesbacteria bacterium]